MTREVISGTHFWQGNEACAEAAIVSGCRFFAGYPITPASEIGEHLAWRLPQVDGITVQMEDEIASLGAVIGASWTGAKAMTATSVVALTIYDMCKAVDRGMKIENIRLVKKSGGKSGTIELE